MDGELAGPRRHRVARACRALIDALGLDLDDPNLAGTPMRIARMYEELFSGLGGGAEPELRTSRLVGLSKLARVVDHHARQPQIQERLTEQVITLIERRLAPRGAMVVVEGGTCAWRCAASPRRMR